MTEGLWPSPEWRRAPAVFAFFVLQMMNNGSPEFIFLAYARGSTSNLILSSGVWWWPVGAL